jgi:hypothetical protein
MAHARRVGVVGIVRKDVEELAAENVAARYASLTPAIRRSGVRTRYRPGADSNSCRKSGDDGPGDDMSRLED